MFKWLVLILTVIVIVVGLSLDVSSTDEVASPGDWIKEEQITVYDNRVVLDILNPTWATFTDTNSMDPFLDETSHALEILPLADQIEVGDIISYRALDSVVVHRVIEKGVDSSGIYYIVKGDNNSTEDPFKVRYEDIEGVVVAVIY